MGMVVDATLHHNQRADPLSCPVLCLKTSPQRSLREPLPYVLPPSCGQSWRTARHGAALQAREIILVLPEVLRPLAYSHPTDAHTAGDLRLCQRASLQQAANL
jgi:hypothetical protein